LGAWKTRWNSIGSCPDNVGRERRVRIVRSCWARWVGRHAKLRRRAKSSNRIKPRSRHDHGCPLNRTEQVDSTERRGQPQGPNRLRPRRARTLHFSSRERSRMPGWQSQGPWAPDSPNSPPQAGGTNRARQPLTQDGWGESPDGRPQAVGLLVSSSHGRIEPKQGSRRWSEGWRRYCGHIGDRDEQDQSFPRGGGSELP